MSLTDENYLYHRHVYFLSLKNTMASTETFERSSLVQAFADKWVLKTAWNYTLKSGRVSPYFFNLGLLFSTAEWLDFLGRIYSERVSALIDQKQLDPNEVVVFGPAYKGIPIGAVATANLKSYGDRFNKVGFAFNRKEAKDHGEGGVLVGAPVKKQKIILLDDVLTAGTALRESVDLLRAAAANPIAAIVAMDRQEIVEEWDPRSAVQAAQATTGLQVGSIITVDDVRSYLVQQWGHEETLAAMDAYRARYGATAA